MTTPAAASAIPAAKSLLILGRQPELGLAELESLFGSNHVQSVGKQKQAALLHIAPGQVDFKRLGGSLKLAKVLTRLDTTDWAKIEQYLRKSLPEHLQYVPEGKFKLGLSAHGFDITPAKLNATALTLKKTVKNSGRSVRVVPNKELELNTAQVLHNGLITATGWELLLVRDDSPQNPGTWIAQTTAIQDIDAYAARDQARPKRDARVGMLPPKLAQIIVNLAVATTQPDTALTVLDPFCGTGVILQEALLMGFSGYGTDLEQRMVDFTNKNLDWLGQTYELRGTLATETGDATTHTWKPQPAFVACESYLGRPFTTQPDGETLARTITDCNQIIRKFLRNIHAQLPTNARLCLAVPSWQTRPGVFRQLPLIDHLGELGYNRLSFEHIGDQDLRYYRADQVVARQLLVLSKQ